MTRALSDAMHDLRYALRLLRRSPIFTAVAVASLALGIGGAAAVFTLINAIVLRTLPIEEPDRLFVAERHTGDDVSPRFSWPGVMFLRNDLAGQAELAAASSIATLQLRADEGTGAGAAERGYVQLVSGEYFDVLRQRAAVGRLLTAADNTQLHGHPVAVISHGYWQRQFGGARDVTGRTLSINNTLFTIIGVTQPGFFGTTVSIRGADVWVPLMMQSAVRYSGNASTHGNGDTRQPWPPQRDVEWLNLFVRVPRTADPASIAAALTVKRQAEASSIREGDAAYLERLRAERVALEPAGRGISSLRNGAAMTLYVLLGMMTVLLLIACGNVAGLLTARATSRQREIAVRLSLGAGRFRLIRQLLVESLVIGLGGGLLGLALALWGRDLLLALFVNGQNVIVTLDTGIDWRVVAFATAMTGVTGLLCGLIPAFRGTGVPIAESLKVQARTVGVESRRTLLIGRALVVAQMAFCLLLLVIAALFVRSLNALAGSEIGFDRHHVVAARLDVRSLGLGAEERLLLYDRLLARVQALPGVVSASLSQNGPVVGSSQISGMNIEGYTPREGERMTTNEEFVTQDYFSTVGLRIVSGRGFTAQDRVPAGRATLVNETLARRFFPKGDAVGKRWAYDADQVSTNEAFVIVGVVEDAKYRDLRSTVPPMAYHLSGPAEDATLADLEVRTSTAPQAMIASVRQALADAEPRLPAYDIAPLADRVSRSLSQDAVVAQLTAVFSGIALLLGCLGLYGTIS
ncbi:MAG TPA: ADOP family duplicated permease, partial [Vicinamibacterales bacterium]|nr:ADOP family duplicated permease [Vicinamibacterales bacterium]